MQFAVEAAEDPVGAVDGPGVSEGFVAGCLGGMGGWTDAWSELLAHRISKNARLGTLTRMPGDVGVAIGEAHEAFALEG